MCENPRANKPSPGPTIHPGKPDTGKPKPRRPLGNPGVSPKPKATMTEAEMLANYTNLALTEYPNVYFVGDALSARGITVSGAHGIYVAEYLLTNVQ